MKKKRIGILTGGGDVAPLNCVIASALEQAKENGIELYGFIKGWQGLLDGNYVNLSDVKISSQIGGTILKSSRVNLKKIDEPEKKITNNINKYNLDGLIVIGGEDTLSNSLLLKNIPQVLISKTIDNDVGINNKNGIVNYFTLGYPTAAEKISSFVSLNEGLRTTAYSHERIIIVESMGMHAGWLALASSFGHPDFIIIPEFPLDYDLLLDKIKSKYSISKNLIIVISEGARWKDGNYISANENDKDSYGHPKFLGAATVFADRLKKDLVSQMDTRNINHVNPSYLYRSGKPNSLDSKAATILGRKAVEILKNDPKEPIFLTLQKSNFEFEAKEFYLKNIDTIEDIHRFVDDRFYDSSEFVITSEGKDYLSFIIKELPKLVYGLS
jgi:6-phosphofructokinase 1